MGRRGLPAYLPFCTWYLAWGLAVSALARDPRRGVLPFMLTMFLTGAVVRPGVLVTAMGRGQMATPSRCSTRGV